MPCGHYFGKEELFEVSVTASSHPRPLSPPLFRLPAELRVSVCPLHARLCSLVMFRMGGSGYVSTTRVLCAAASFRQTMTRCPACVLSRTPSCMRALSLCVVLRENVCVQYNEHKRLTLEQVSRAAVSACQAADDMIGKRICCVREAVLQGMLEESCVHLSIEAPGEHQYDAAIAAVNRCVSNPRSFQ
jgi:hypothetical protein